MVQKGGARGPNHSVKINGNTAVRAIRRIKRIITQRTEVMIDIATKLQRIAEASRRPDGSNTPLSEQVMEGVDHIVKLRQALNACIIVLKNRDRSPSEQRIYDFARDALGDLNVQAFP
jgi:hypothetical protein